MRTVLATSTIFMCALPIAAEDANSAPISGEQLGRMLSTMGFEPQSLSQFVYQVTITHDGWQVHTLVSLSPDRGRVWLECKFPPVPKPEQVPASAWRRLLEENERIGPAHFAFKKEDGRIHLFQPIDNIDLTPARLRTEIESFDHIVRKTQAVWAAEPFRPLPGPEIVSVLPREVPPDTSVQLRQLQGTWRIVTLEMRGQRASREQLDDVKPAMIFEKETAVLQTGAVEKVTTIRLGAAAPVMEIDFVDSKKQVEKGIWKLDGDTLTVAFAAPGQARPLEFSTDSERTTWLLVMKRERR